MTHIKKIINFRAENETSSLRALRQKYVNVLTVLLMLISIILTTYYFSVDQVSKSLLSSTGIIVCSIVAYSNYKLKLETTSIILCFLVTIIVSSATFFQIVDPAESVPQAGYLVTSFLFIIGSNKARIIYILFVSIVMTILVLHFDIELIKTVPVLIQIIVLIVLHNFLILFIESQDKKIDKSIIELTNNNLRIKKLNDSLKIQNEEITTFSHAMSHDLKEPIRNITAFIDLLKKKGETIDPKSDKHLEIINNSATSMRSLIDDLLLYAKINHKELTLESIDLAQLINEILPNFQYTIESKNAKIEIGELPIIQGNKQLLKVLFHNFISNALKFQPKTEGHIPSIKINSDSKNGDIYFTDNGLGFDESFIQNMFVPFKRYHSKNEYAGSGLGLSICMKVMDKHGGILKLLDTSKNGTTFLLRFTNSKPNKDELVSLEYLQN